LQGEPGSRHKGAHSASRIFVAYVPSKPPPWKGAARQQLTTSRILDSLTRST